MNNSVQTHRKSVFILKYFITNRQVQGKGWGKKAAECLVQDCIRETNLLHPIYALQTALW